AWLASLNGADGADGSNGVGITGTADNGDGTFTITYSDNSTFTTADLTGPAGASADVLKSFVKYNVTSGYSLLSVSLLNGYSVTNFPSSGEEFDENSEYDASTSTFTAKQDGIYEVYVQANSKGAVSAAEFGVGIFKEDGTSGSISLLAEDRYLSVNVSVLTIDLDVSPPTRSTQTLVKLNAGDKIKFGTYVPLLAAGVLNGFESQFSIHQVK
uniref:hypothetical protein n=1 Tax=Formosa sp. 3Alg 14/1 TaxID=3382190 RepID=UPI0039BDF57D